jgi:hypothetical protein
VHDQRNDPYQRRDLIPIGQRRLFSVGPAGRRVPLPATSPRPWRRTAPRSAPATITPSARRAGAPKLGGAEHLIRLVLPQGDLRDRPDIEA